MHDNEDTLLNVNWEGQLCVVSLEDELLSLRESVAAVRRRIESFSDVTQRINSRHKADTTYS